MAKAEMGAGTLIMFVAVLFCAATAASVFIQTTSSAQGRAYAVAKEATKQVSTSLMVFEASGVDGTSALENITLTVKVAPGADELPIDEVSITLSTKNTSTSYVSSRSASYSVDTVNQNGTFGYTYIQYGKNHEQGLLSAGDLALITVQSPRALKTGEDLKIRLIPSEGMPVFVSVNLPNVLTVQHVHLYP